MRSQETLLPFAHADKEKFSYVCNLCKDKGDVLANLKDDHRIYVFTCSCVKGQRSQKRFTAWPGLKAGYVVAE